jgi:eukaryotic-like serine/threonine-protein kinase
MVLDHARTDDLGLIGRILAGGLRVMERTGLSPLGPLYEAEDPDGRRVVLLILPVRASWQEPAGVRSLRFASRIRHPNVAGVYAIGNLEDGSTYVVLERLVGEPLPELLSARAALPIGEALDLTVQIAAGLEALHHGGLVHGSVSPSAVVVTRPPFGKSQVKLVGFSLDSDGERATRLEDGTADYASPERLAGSPPDVRGDVFSAGAVFHYLLSGSPPPRDPPVGKVPRIARPVLERALAPLTAGRFRTMTEFREAVEALAAAAVTPPESVAARRILGRALAAGLALLAGGALLAPVLRSVDIGWGRPSAVAPPPAPTRSAAAADSEATATVPEARRGRVRTAEPRRSTEAGRIPAESRDRTPVPEPTPAGPTGDRPTETRDEAPKALGYVGQPRSSDLSPDTVGRAPPPPQPPRPTPAAVPNSPPAKPPRPLAELQQDPGLRLAISDVTRVGLAQNVVEAQLGVLVVQLAPDGLSVPSASYNLQRLYLAYSAATDHQQDTIALELRRKGEVVGWFTREGLRHASSDRGRR